MKSKIALLNLIFIFTISLYAQDPLESMSWSELGSFKIAEDVVLVIDTKCYYSQSATKHKRKTRIVNSSDKTVSFKLNIEGIGYVTSYFLNPGEKVERYGDGIGCDLISGPSNWKLTEVKINSVKINDIRLSKD